ncbi:MAG: response regulator [Brasilonema sp.]
MLHTTKLITPTTVVGQANNGREVVEMFAQLQPDITLIDLRMPEMDGVAAIKVIREQFPSARLIVLTTYDGDEDIYRGLQAGAKAYLLKDVPREELLACIRAVYVGRLFITPEVGAKLAHLMNSLKRQMNQQRRRRGFLSSKEGLEKFEIRMLQKSYTQESLAEAASVSVDQVKKLLNPLGLTH